MQISVEGRDRTQAAEAAGALVEILIARAAIRPETVSVLEPASAPEAPARPRRALNIGLALLLGLVGGAGTAFLVERLDSRLYTPRHVEEAVDQAILGAVPTTPRARRGALFDATSPEQEALRRVRAHLLESDRGARPRSLLVTSAEPGEGKSTVAANLAVSIAQTGRATVVVDGDLRLPSLHRIFGLPNEVGLSDLLSHEATLDRAVQASHVDGLRVITSGRLPPNPAELLGSCAMTAVLERLAGRFDAIVLDAPSLLAVADALTLAPAVDGVLLVVGRAQARAEAVRSARDELIRAQARSVGVVVNRAEPDGRQGYYRRATVEA
jgi:capsular exopolysaccharide synthesis family protein